MWYSWQTGFWNSTEKLKDGTGVIFTPVADQEYYADADPSDPKIEITCREQCFAPEFPFLSYIKVKGITCAHAATGAPVPQRGALSCYRGHHWIIEDCTIDWSNAVGIDVGNECWHHELIPGGRNEQRRNFCGCKAYQ